MLTFHPIVNDRQAIEAHVDRWAELLESSGLSSVALPLIEMVTAFGFLGQQALLAVEPLVREGSDEKIGKTGHLLDDPERWRRLRRRLTRGESNDD